MKVSACQYALRYAQQWIVLNRKHKNINWFNIGSINNAGCNSRDHWIMVRSAINKQWRYNSVGWRRYASKARTIHPWLLQSLPKHYLSLLSTAAAQKTEDFEVAKSIFEDAPVSERRTSVKREGRRCLRMESHGNPNNDAITYRVHSRCLSLFVRRFNSTDIVSPENHVILDCACAYFDLYENYPRRDAKNIEFPV